MSLYLVKTEKEIGTFVQSSFIDGRSIREVSSEELSSLDPTEYELINTESARIFPSIQDGIESMLGEEFGVFINHTEREDERNS